MNFVVEGQWDENEVTSAMTDLHQENKAYVLLRKLCFELLLLVT